jgi:Phosphate-selective porin O and P
MNRIISEYLNKNDLHLRLVFATVPLNLVKTSDMKMMFGDRMTKQSLYATSVATLLAATSMGVNAASTPSAEEMWQIIQQQQQEIAALKAQAQKRENQFMVVEERLDDTADALEHVAEMQPAVGNGGGHTSIGGYAEMHYNNLEDQNGDSDTQEMDFHRFVLFLGHEFSDKTRFFSELELEHSIAGDGQEGEFELEQAYVEHDYLRNHSLKAGLFLMPVGIINETHEPPTFYGVERNPVEKNIIPATWWEGGLASTGRFGEGFSYDVAVTSGLGLEDGEYKIRDGRQKVAKAKADALAYTGRLKYTGIAGLELGMTAQYQEDLYQDTLADTIDATLLEAHAAWQVGDFGLRALYAIWDIDDAINAIKEGADEQTGWYIEPSWRISERWGVFARYNDWDNLAGASVDGGITQVDVGINYWLNPNVVFKFDYQDQDTEDSDAKELDGFNLGVGWQF